MTPIRIFVSSVQSEFAEERNTLRAYIRDDVLMRRFFDVFLFEDAPAADRSPDHLYLDEVGRSDIYLGLFGHEYGSENGTGISPTEREFDHATRAENARAPRTYEIPVEVVTEAIVNAVAHRDYTDNGSVQVMLFADRLEVRNPGRLPPPLTLEKLREAHRSVPGNPLLAESLYLMEYIERMGTGTLDMIRRCVAAGLPEPEFAVTDGFVTTVWRASANAEVPAPTTEGHDEGQAGGHGGQAAPSGKDTALLRACIDGPVPGEALLAAVGYAHRTGHFRRWLDRLQREGLLEMTIPDKPRSPAQKYRLTNKGRRAVATADGDHWARR